MIKNINASDVLTFDDNTKFLVLYKITQFKKPYYLLIGVKNDDLDFNEIVYVTEDIDEEGNEYIKEVEDIEILNKLTNYVLNNAMNEFSSEVKDDLKEALNTNL